MPAQASDDRFEQAKRHFFAGLESHQAARFAEAETHYLASLALLPGRASTLVNLAATQVLLVKPEAALATADLALAAEPGSTDALLHRATAQLQLARWPDALATLDRLLKLDPAYTEAWLRRAHALQRLERLDEALASYREVLARDPAHAAAWSGSGGLLRELRRLDESAHAFREALRHGAEPTLHGYYLAAVEGRDAPAIAPEAYVQALFDSYADDFDAHLVGKLGYDAHQQLVHTLAELAPGLYRSALDLGCGTGLCGPLVRPMSGRLTGIDLSPLMLEKARALGTYDQLDTADIQTWLDRTTERFDLVLAADVFIYIGDLAPVFAAVRRVMPQGVFCFSVEVPPGGSAAAGADGFQLQASLRYAHPESCLRRLAADHGFEVIACRPAALREDQRHTVAGLFVYLRAGAASASGAG